MSASFVRGAAPLLHFVFLAVFAYPRGAVAVHRQLRDRNPFGPLPFFGAGHKPKWKCEKASDCHSLIFCNLYVSVPSKQVDVFFSPYFGRGQKVTRLTQGTPYGDCTQSMTLHETRLGVSEFDRGQLTLKDSGTGHVLGGSKYDLPMDADPHYIVVFLERKGPLDLNAKITVQHVPKSTTHLKSTYVPMIFHNGFKGHDGGQITETDTGRKIDMTQTQLAIPPGTMGDWTGYDGNHRLRQKFPAQVGDLLIMMLFGNEPVKKYAQHYKAIDMICWSKNQGLLLGGHCNCKSDDWQCCEGLCTGVSCGLSGECNPLDGTCICDPGYQGDACNERITTTTTTTTTLAAKNATNATAKDPASPGSPAVKEGTTYCSPGDGTCGEFGECAADGARCICDPGWNGTTCEEAIEPEPYAVQNGSALPVPFPDFQKPPLAEKSGNGTSIPWVPIPFPDMYEPLDEAVVNISINKSSGSPVPVPVSNGTRPATNATSRDWNPTPPTYIDEPQQCEPPCEPHGRCDTDTGRCNCDPGWLGDSCDERAEVAPETLAPGCTPALCGPHGVCGDDGLCRCESGWTGADCGTKVKPYDEDDIATEDWDEKEKEPTTTRQNLQPNPFGAGSGAGAGSRDKSWWDELHEILPWWWSLLALIAAICIGFICAWCKGG